MAPREERILFVCSGNMYRSPTAEDMLRERGYGEVRSAGTHPGAPTRLTRELVGWADRIFAMEEEHRVFIVGMWPEAEGKITVLGIPDVYWRNDPTLRRILEEKLSAHLKLDE
ncbi:MAG: protein tyrosine phosphatase [Candidatus Geothermarchaeales archaeon]